MKINFAQLPAALFALAMPIWVQASSAELQVQCEGGSPRTRVQFEISPLSKQIQVISGLGGKNPTVERFSPSSGIFDHASVSILVDGQPAEITVRGSYATYTRSDYFSEVTIRFQRRGVTDKYTLAQYADWSKRNPFNDDSGQRLHPEMIGMECLILGPKEVPGTPSV